MPTLASLHKLRWSVVKSGVVYNPDAALAKYFRAHPEVGSPIGPETPLEDGKIGQAFTGAVLVYDPASGVVSQATE